jgi:cytochrome c2
VRPVAAIARAVVAMAAVSLVACSRGAERPADAGVDRWSEAGMLAEGARYVDDPAFRRSALVASLTNPDNIYSRQRLSRYALATRGWDLLPEWNPRAVVLTGAMVEGLRAGRRPALDDATPALWDGARPATMAAWVSLGREVFFRYPLRREVYLEWAIARADGGAPFGVASAGDGSVPGAVAFVDTSGRSQVGMTCAMCHASVEGGRVVVGQARRGFDYGALRSAYHVATGAYVHPELARRMRTWGPGRADITEDDDEDPVAIPDLWGLRHEAFLTQAGSLRQAGPAALAIRQETQLLTSNQQAVRPPRVLAYALAMYLYALRAPESVPAPASPALVRGKELFLHDCATCHSNAAGGGDLVRVDRVETDAALARGAARGTGAYRVAPLVRVARAAPYFHHGAVATLDDVLSPARLTASYAGGVLGPGPVPGHPYGTDLLRSDRDALVTYLDTL